MHIIDDVISSSMAPESIISNNIISTKISSTKISVDSIDFSNYDVLLMPSSTEGVVSFAPGNHVGNQRFRVLLSLHRSRYLQADKIDDDDMCTKIAKDVLDLVCNKCIPNGRFFEQVDTDDGNSNWKELDVNLSTIELIKQALKNEPTTSPLMSPPKQLRRRRRTYGSIVSEDSEGEATITKPDRFDVICESNGQQLKFGSEHTGNYRLKVLLDMRLSSSSWRMSSPSDKEQAAHDIVSSIVDASSSRFLRVKNDVEEGYVIMSREMAEECIMNSLSQISYEKGIKKHQQQPIVQHESEIEMLLRRKRKKDTLEQCAKRVKLQSCDYCTMSSAAGLPTTFNTLPFDAITSRAA